jgi:hypothetical protein
MNVCQDVLKDSMEIKNQELANLVIQHVLDVGDLMKTNVNLVLLHLLLLNLPVVKIVQMVWLLNKENVSNVKDVKSAKENLIHVFLVKKENSLRMDNVYLVVLTVLPVKKMLMSVLLVLLNYSLILREFA